ncbi:MAG: alcohol dehydrogenase [Ruminococcaceae bacterium]|nr:alcohol dehydrogenase [Oscillospiraceae bacterium]
MSLPKRMRAAVLYDYNDLRVVDRDVPAPGEQEVLIQVKACAICGSDPKIVAHGWPNCPPMGEYIPGHEFSGVIAAVGSGVTGYRAGDRVAVEPHKGCGHCINCIRGLYTTCLNYGKLEEGHRHYGFTVNGGYAEYAVCHINCIHKFSETLSYEDATLLTTAGTALYGIQRAGGIWPGETVVVIGPGPIGLMAVQLAKVLGAGRVILVGTRESRLATGKEVGADITMNSRETDAVQAISELTGGVMADMVVETSGSTGGGAQAVELVKKSGRVAFVGIYSEPVTLNLNKVVQWNVQLAGGKAEGEDVLDRIVPLMESGRIKTKPLLTHEFSLEQINEGMNTYINRVGNALKVVIKP